MKVTLGTLFNASQPRGDGKKKKAAILQELADSNIPVVTAYRMGKVLAKVQEELKTFEERRIGLLNKHAKKDENGALPKGQVEWEEGKYDEFLKEFTELLAVEVDMDVKAVKLSELSLAGISVAPKEMGLISFMIIDED